MPRISSPFKRTPTDTVEVRLQQWQRDLLGDLPGQLQELLHEDTPATRRLFPAAYHSNVDGEREAEYQRLMREELVASRLAAAEAVKATAHNETITLDELGTWVNVFNSLRLVLGTQLDVSEDDDEPDEDDDLRPAYELYWWLGYLVECGVETLSS